VSPRELPWRLRLGWPRRSQVGTRGSVPGSVAASCLAIALIWIASCSRTDPNVDHASSERTAAVATHPFLESIADATFKIAYSGTRHVRLTYVVEGAPKVLEYDETVSSDGHGKFAIVPGKVESPEMSADQAAFFAILQERRDGFFYRYRDFRIRDWKAFLRNWSVQDQGLRESVAGRACVVLEFRRRRDESGGRADETGAHYRAWIDPETALVLRAQEFDASGAQVSLVEFRDLTLAPDLSNVALHADRSEPKRFDPDADTTATLGFPLLRPKILPEGYRVERAEIVRASGSSASDTSAADESARATPAGSVPDRWARIEYGDGVDEIFFLQSAVPDAAEASTTPEERDLGSRYVRILHVGPWTVLQGRFDRTQSIVMGKVDEDALLRMLKSAVQ
jgi:hypothetical protein